MTNASASEEMLASRCVCLIAKHGSVRAAARALNMDHAYLYRLKMGEKLNPSKEILRKLGLRKVIYYERI